MSRPARLAALAVTLFALMSIAPATANRSWQPAGDWLSAAFQKPEPVATRTGKRGTANRGATGRGASSGGETRSTPSSSGVGPRPSAWCGWYMRTRRGGGPEMNLAWNWSRYGSPASPQVGAVVVWRHHVGEIVGKSANGQWIVLSGNDGGAVRSRPRSIAGAVVRM